MRPAATLFSLTRRFSTLPAPATVAPVTSRATTAWLMLKCSSLERLVIPPEVCEPDNSSCLLPKQNATQNCIMGGLHTYITTKGDTPERIALYKLNITVDALLETASGNIGPGASANTEITIGTSIKVPICKPSECIMQPLKFAYGTYKDLAEQLSTTPGQPFAFNPTYNYSSVEQGQGAYLADPVNCRVLSNNLTAVS